MDQYPDYFHRKVIGVSNEGRHRERISSMDQYEAGYADLKPTRQTGLEEAAVRGGHKPTEAELEDLFRAPDDNDRGTVQKHYTPDPLAQDPKGWWTLSLTTTYYVERVAEGFTTWEEAYKWAKKISRKQGRQIVVLEETTRMIQVRA